MIFVKYGRVNSDVPIEDLRKFNRIRAEVVEKRPEYSKYFKSRSSCVLTFVYLLNNNPEGVLRLLDDTNGVKNE